MYSYADLEERNLTYEVEAFEPNYFMIGQDGDLATLFEEIIPTTTRYIQMILGHQGHRKMKKEADDILRFIALGEENNCFVDVLCYLE